MAKYVQKSDRYTIKKVGTKVNRIGQDK